MKISYILNLQISFGVIENKLNGQFKLLNLDNKELCNLRKSLSRMINGNSVMWILILFSNEFMFRGWVKTIVVILLPFAVYCKESYIIVLRI